MLTKEDVMINLDSWIDEGADVAYDAPIVSFYLWL